MQRAVRDLAGEVGRQTRKNIVSHLLVTEIFSRGVPQSDLYSHGPLYILATTWQIDLRKKKTGDCKGEAAFKVAW